MHNKLPIIGITMGDPVGIGPEIIISALSKTSVYDICRPLVIGDIRILENVCKIKSMILDIKRTDKPEHGRYTCGNIDVLSVSNLDPSSVSWGKPNKETSKAMVRYIETAVDMTSAGDMAAMVTCPINKAAMKMAGSRFHGHTELLADRTKTENIVMMLAGKRLRVVLVTVHTALKNVPAELTTEKIMKTIDITDRALKKRFGLKNPDIAVAGLNPHSGEQGMFGDEEDRLIHPVLKTAKQKGINATGPFPPDTVFYHAANGLYDAVVCMYHDQGLIPFKLLHFKDGVNTTLGLPIIRTSVDHGTAYDIAGTGQADSGSLIAAIEMAVSQYSKSNFRHL